jgi:dihydroneopterin aldolase
MYVFFQNRIEKQTKVGNTEQENNGKQPLLFSFTTEIPLKKKDETNTVEK